ncbi:hypothetical protein [Dyella sp. ASV21]|nr:hypothetical protein [Dyella sp. ASV21]
MFAHAKLTGGGESATATMPVATLKAGESDAYFRTSPGMRHR